MITGLLMLTKILDFSKSFIEFTMDNHTFYASNVLSSIFYIISLILALIIMRFEFSKGVQSSGMIFFYWGILFLFSIFMTSVRFHIFLNYLEQNLIQDTFRMILDTIAMLLSGLNFVSHFFADNKASQFKYQDTSTLELTSQIKASNRHVFDSDSFRSDKSDENVPLLFSTPENYPKKSSSLLLKMRDTQEMNIIYKRPSPELKASFFSRITFFWITPLILKGFRRSLTTLDLYDLKYSESCANIVPKLEFEWIKSQVKLNRLNKNKVEKFNVVNYLHSDGRNSSSSGMRPLSDSENNLNYKNIEPHLTFNQERNSTSSVRSNSGSDVEAPKPSFLKILVKIFGPYYLVTGVYKLLYDLLTFVQPQLLNYLIGFLISGDQFTWHGYILAFYIFLVAMIRTLLFQKYWHGCYLTGLRVRTGVIGLVYRKALKLTCASRKDTTVGEIVNLMSVDAQILQDVNSFIHMVWSTPLTIFVSIYFLWKELGPSILAGLLVMVLLIPINSILAAKQKKLQMTQMKFKDQRIKLMTEILSGIKVLKLYAWEDSFESRVEDIRKKEVLLLRKATILNSIAAISWFCSPFFVSLFSFMTYVLSSPENVLTPNKTFVSLSLFNILNFPMSILPGVIVYMIQASVSIKRIKKFLSNEELDISAISYGSNISEHSIIVDNASFSWSKSQPDVLKNINLKIPAGSFVAIVGNIGSGKSCLINSIIGEIHKSNGFVSISGKVAYVSQVAWCQNCNLQDNITFGKKLDTHIYRRVITACALESDIKMLPGGDLTEIGEKGINLSGGQKQRISIARAVYQDADIYILDDPLSAVDAHVGKHIFEEVISSKTGMLRNKTRILVTHGLSFLPQVDYIIVMRDSEISEIGTYKELLSRNGAFAEYLRTYLDRCNEENLTEYVQEDTDLDEFIDEVNLSVTMKQAEEDDERIKKEIRMSLNRLDGSFSKDDNDIKVSTKKSNITKKSSRAISNARKSNKNSLGYESQQSLMKLRQLSRNMSRRKESMNQAFNENRSKLVTEENVETGSVKFAIFLTYIKAASAVAMIAIALSYVSFLASSVGANIWLSFWSEKSINTTKQDLQSTAFYLGIYSSFGISQSVFVLIQNLFLALASYNASNQLHRTILRNILKAPMCFFDTTPLGRIINRFGKDIDTIDVNIPLTFRIWLTTMASVLTSLILISIGSPIFIVTLVPLILVYYFIQRLYINSSRQLKRIDSIKRSPIYSHFQETLVGVSSIRAFKKQRDFIRVSDKLVDENQSAWYPTIVSYRWLGINLETIGNFVILLAGVFAVLMKDSSNIGLAALSITYSLQITGALNFMVRMNADLESNIVAVERVDEYTKIPTESQVPNQVVIRPNWPESGEIEFRNYSVRYRESLDLVLKNLSFRINPGEKIGIVGRTGAGKSSLTLAVFRILEPASGSIFIDGVDIANISLYELRSHISIIPQDPIIFSGSLRENLDPFERYRDSEIWSVLEQAHLKNFVVTQAAGLNFFCSENGDNLSVGQRQLVCLARALLRRAKIILLDEATAAVDMETDSFIQNTIRQEFKDCTILTIAHRLNTIMDYDRVIVLDRGRIHEFDSPNRLLNNEKSIFYSMAKDAELI